MSDVTALIEALLKGDRRAVARAITIVESDSAKDAHSKSLILGAVKDVKRALRVGISGSPGAGKSSFIEVLGLLLVSKGHKVGVLAVDPSSPISKGSILGDKTRMTALAKDTRAFIRPSPTRGVLGGVSPNSEEVIRVLEAAAFDVVLVETVGVGQSEVAVATMVDTFVLLVPPASGDELQGVKKGIVELAHIVGVTKHDSDLKERAEKTRQEYMHALLSGGGIKSKKWRVRVDLLSSKSGEGIAEFWQDVLDHETFRGTSR
jgi:LAO/AO transport system kinase